MKVRVDSMPLVRRLRKMQADARHHARGEMKVAGRIFVKEVLRWTPPASLKTPGNKGLVALEKRIEADLRRGFKVLPGKPSKKQLAAMGVHDGSMRKYVTDIGAHVKNWRFYRKNSTARLARPRRELKHVTSEAALKREVAARKKRVGLLMAGWRASARLFGGVRMPAKAARHGSGAGSARIWSASAHVAMLESVNRADKHGAGLANLLARREKRIKASIHYRLKKRSKILRDKMKRK